ncbi:YoaK family protein [Acinetobacter bereziniae]|uniref:YoaK family protein n=1 Tax=Acinetobacter bereziniae TaxID=106648 RepID=UPI00148F192C|nr:YoaK family protein [Acinetobacter bereziniae]
MFINFPKKALILLFIFALNAGLINSITLISFFHQPVTHMTGNVSLLANDLYFSLYPHFSFLLIIIFAFFSGTILSGYILGFSDFKFEASYGYLLSIEVACILFCLIFSYLKNSNLTIIFAAISAGVQNSLLSSYKGINIRTTHLTGVFTDLGLAIGLKIRKVNIPFQRFSLNIAILTGFSLGCFLSIPSLNYLHRFSFFAPLSISTSLCLGYWFKYITQSKKSTSL